MKNKFPHVLTVSISLSSLMFVAGWCTPDPTPAPKTPTTTAPTTTTPTTPTSSTPTTTQRTTTKWTGSDTHFLASQLHRLSKQGDVYLEEFSLSKTTSLVFNVATQYKSQVAIIRPDQLDNFKNNRAFSGPAVFDEKMGIQPITLAAGTYYVGMRNTTNGSNIVSYELDYTISLPASDRCRYNDTYISNYQFYAAGTKMWHPFTIQTGFRYFIDGCNTGMNVFFIAANQFDKFKNGQSFTHYADFKQGDNNGGDPGGVEITLPPGDYYLVARNESKESQAIVYAMQRWLLY